MEKIIRMLLPGLCCLLVLSACAQASGGLTNLSTLSEQSAPNDDLLGVRLSADGVKPTGLTLICTQSGGQPTGELLTGTPYWLEEWNDGQWTSLDCLPASSRRVPLGLDGRRPPYHHGGRHHMGAGLGGTVRRPLRRDLPGGQDHYGLSRQWRL